MTVYCVEFSVRELGIHEQQKAGYKTRIQERPKSVKCVTRREPPRRRRGARWPGGRQPVPAATRWLTQAGVIDLLRLRAPAQRSRERRAAPRIGLGLSLRGHTT